MKIAGVSDLHGNLIDIPNCDVLCICGDVIPLMIQRNSELSHKWWIEDFCAWVNKLPCKKVIVTAGNHDIFLEKIYQNTEEYSAFKEELSKNSENKLVLLIDEEYEYEGIKFYGFPYTRPIPFQKGRWAFEDNCDSVDDIGVYSSLKHLDVDVLVTHDSPFHNEYLEDTVKNLERKPRMHLYGHWHEGESDIFCGKVCCSVLNNSYKLNGRTITTFHLDIEDRFKVLMDHAKEYCESFNYNETIMHIIQDFLVINKPIIENG